MSKRQSTLFNYFTSPKVNKKPEEDRKKAEIEPVKDESQSVRKRQREDEDDEIISRCNKQPSKKVQRSSSGSETENFSPNKKSKTKRIKRPLDSSSSESETETDTKQNLKKFSFKKEQDVKPEIATTRSDTKQNLKKFSFKKEQDVKPEIATTRSITSIPKDLPKEVKDIHSNWLHNSLDFLKPEKIMDIKKRKPNHPDYDSRTLYVPETFLSSLTPAMRQWWDLKKHHMDSILFFKVGKFYELYHMDAVVGVKQLNFSYMKGEFAHSGFPETAYGKMATSLLEKGYKVARVEQTETPDMMAVRLKTTKSATKFDKVVKREICQVSTKSTCIYTAQMPDSQNETPYYLYAICMKEASHGTVRIGVCFVETSLGTFDLSEFNDDKHFSRLLALFAEYPPAMILTEKGGINKQLSQLLNCNFKDIKKDSLVSNSQFHSATDTLEKLSTACYFRDTDGEFEWPKLFKTIADDCMPKNEFELTIRCIGACMWYLKDSKIDIQVFSVGKFKWYDPLEFTEREKTCQDYLLLDSVTIQNLDLLDSKISLKQTLDHCETAFGKRLLVRWICRPLCDIEKIKERQNAVKYLWDNSNILSSAKVILKKMPDLERQLIKIHTYGNKFLATDHPDGRAIFYEAKTYSKKKVKDFLKTLRALEKAHEIVDIFKDCEDRFLKKITQFEPRGVNVDLSEVLAYFKTAFDQEEAEKDGKIIPKRGVVPEYDDIENTINTLNKQLDSYLKEQCKFFGCKVNYVGTEKKRFQLEVPANMSSKANDKYLLEGARKGAKPVNKFSTQMTRDFLAEMLEAEAEKSKIIHDLNRKIFEKFSTKQDQFSRFVQCLTILDVLCSLAYYARSYSQDICLPKLLPFENQPKIVMENGRHPCIQNIDNFVPNDIKMGANGHASILILTGPNMGGKSTLMRQVAVIAVMAQIGSFVPASMCELNLIDRIFTRLGAQDDILQGQSTFYVELSEASCILQHATKHSLVIIDELGRGTSTHDGNAIATAYVKKLTEIKCRTTFSTHYHSLVNNFRENTDVQLTHMACMVENDEDPTQESVTFLYKLANGVCPKSYGFNAAKLAGLAHSIIVRGREVAKNMEEKTHFRNTFTYIFNNNIFNIAKIREALCAITQ